MDEPTVLLAPDKFKGCLTAAGVAAALAAGMREVAPEVRIRTVPVADGGDGTVAALVARGWGLLEVPVTGPDGRRVVARVARRGSRAVVESAATSGLDLLAGTGLRPLTAGSRGVGEAITAALEAGAREVVVGVGGTACTDGGAGMLAALGARLLDARGRPVPDGGAGLVDLASVDLAPARERLAGASLVVATDVDNPLLGPSGAAAVYGPQKGATADDVRVLERGLRRWADLVRGQPLEGPHASTASHDAPGAGAGGGLGFGLLAGLGGTVRSGIDLVLELVGFVGDAARADLVVTGEGRLDEQTLRGKAVLGVLRAARDAGAAPVVAVCGVDDLGPEATARAGFRRVWSLASVAASPEDAMARAPELLRVVGRELLDVL
ncbi:MAG: glycerate kinase [Actinotalea sp.]|nr:glycerate kinase [Actinotalea sp.]